MNLPRIVLLLVLLGFAMWSWREPPATPLPAADIVDMVEQQSDYYLESFEIRTLDPAGNEVNRIGGASLTHYPHDDTADIIRPRIVISRAESAPWQIVAEQGWLSPGQESLRLDGTVVALRQTHDGKTGMRIESDVMTFDIETQSMHTTLDARIDAADWRARSRGLTIDAHSGNIEMHSEVEINHAPVH